MKFRKGSSRVALVGENFTFKAPYIAPKNLMRIPSDIHLCWQLGKWKGLIEYFTDGDDFTCFQQNLLRGWLQNLRERRVSKLLNDIVVPTHLSLFGLLNVQSTATDINLSMSKLGEIIKGEIPDNIQDAHTFLAPGNYGLHHDSVRLLDYGERGVYEFIQKYRPNFQTAFDTLSHIKIKKPLPRS